MAALRELLALFEVRVDDKQAKSGKVSVDDLASSIRNFAGVAAAAAVGFGIGSFISSIRQMGADLRNTSLQLGLSTQALQEWQFIAGSAGLDAGDLFGAFGAVADNAVQAASGSDDMRKAFAALGVTVKNSNGQFKDISTLILEMADGLGNLSNETERSSILQTIAGDDGLRLLGVLKQQRSGIEAVREEFRRLGGGLSTETIQAASDLDAALGSLSAAFTGISNQIGFVVLPILTTVVNGVTTAISQFREWAEGTHIVEVAFGALGIAAVALAVKIAIAFAPALLTFAAVAAGVTTIILVVDDLIALFTGGQSAIGAFVDEMFGIGTAENVVQDLIALWESFVQIVKDAATIVSDFFSSFRIGELGLDALNAIVPSASASADTSATTSRQGNSNSVSQSNTVNVNVSGGDEDVATRIRNVVTQVLGEQNAEALAALIPEGL